ncbi:MAG: pyridoxamine 5'-phosphate oxidase family protein [Salibacteraceae bacterium]
MLIAPSDSLAEVWQTLKQELRRGAVDKKHPFRFVVMSTAGEGVHSRYVVLRQVQEDFGLVIYTDARSRKLPQLQADHRCQLLFYHPKKQVQVIVSASVDVHQNGSLFDVHLPKAQGYAARSYTTVLPPGTPIAKPKDGMQWDESTLAENFRVLVTQPYAVELLQLGRGEHLRARFHASDNWAGSWLVP